MSGSKYYISPAILSQRKQTKLLSRKVVNSYGLVMIITSRLFWQRLFDSCGGSKTSIWEQKVPDMMRRCSAFQAGWDFDLVQQVNFIFLQEIDCEQCEIHEI